MPRGDRKFKCDCCKRFLPKTKYGYYMHNLEDDEIVLCDDCEEKFKTGKLKLHRLLPIEEYERRSEDMQCSCCQKWYEPTRIELYATDEGLICKQCKERLDATERDES